LNRKKKLDLNKLETLYRGTQLPEQVIQNDYSQLGTIFSWSSFSSTSRNKENAEFFAADGILPSNY